MGFFFDQFKYKISSQSLIICETKHPFLLFLIQTKPSTSQCACGWRKATRSLLPSVMSNLHLRWWSSGESTYPAMVKCCCRIWRSGSLWEFKAWLLCRSACKEKMKCASMFSWCDLFSPCQGECDLVSLLQVMVAIYGETVPVCMRPHPESNEQASCKYHSQTQSTPVT